MTTRLRKYSWILFVSSGLLFSCDKPSCENTNTVFNQYTPDTSEYKNELMKQLAMQKEADLSYWFDSYQMKGEQEYIQVDIVGKGLCAKGLLLVDSWKENMVSLKQTKGQGYHGAKLDGLKIGIKIDATQTQLLLTDLGHIID